MPPEEYNHEVCLLRHEGISEKLDAIFEQTKKNEWTRNVAGTSVYWSCWRSRYAGTHAISRGGTADTICS